MINLGISVYPDIQDFEEIRSYIKLASGYGFTRVFSSMWSIDGTREEILSYFSEFIKVAHTNGMEVDLDVNPELFKKLGADYDDIRIFDELGADILRMDIPYSSDKNKVLINNPYGIKIEFNASIVKDQFVESLKELGNDRKVLTCHNFYPQRYTGMKWDKYLEANRKLKEGNLETGVFVTSQNKDTVGVWDAKDGLCSVEKMRDLPLDVQVRTLMAAGNIDTILIGNACASEEELKLLSETIKDVEPNENQPIVKMMLSMGATKERFYPQKKIRVTLDSDISETEKDILFRFFPHYDVGDSSEWIWRSRMPRFLKKDIPYRKFQGEEFNPGDVLIVNNNYKHYAGEIQIALLPLRNDGIRNKIGTLIKEEQDILKLVNDGDVVVFLQK